MARIKTPFESIIEKKRKEGNVKEYDYDTSIETDRRMSDVFYAGHKEVLSRQSKSFEMLRRGSHRMLR